MARVNPELLARDLAADDAAAAEARAQTVTQARIVRALRLFGDALGAARTSGNARLELETALLRFILQTEDPSLEALAARVNALEAGAPVPAPPPRRGRARGRRRPAADAGPPRAAAGSAPREPRPARPRRPSAPAVAPVRSR